MRYNYMPISSIRHRYSFVQSTVVDKSDVTCAWVAEAVRITPYFGLHFGCAVLILLEVKESNTISKFSIDNVEQIFTCNNDCSSDIKIVANDLFPTLHISSFLFPPT